MPRTANIGHALQQAMRNIEQANSDTLHGIFGDGQWTNKDRLADALFKNLIEHFSSCGAWEPSKTRTIVARNCLAAQHRQVCRLGKA